MSSTLRLALAQVPPQTGAPEPNLRTLDRLAAAASAAGADVLILPEMFLTGYVLGRAQTRALAEPSDGPSAQQVAAIAHKHDVAIIYGYPEQETTGRVFNAVAFIAPDGQRILNYRKLHYFGDVDAEQFDPPPLPAPAAESTTPELGEDAGEALPVVSWRGWRLGVAVCYDIEFPETARALAVKGADLICVPTANMENFDHVQQLLLPARALENQVYLAYANYCGQDSRFRYGGLSCLVGPDGAMVKSADRAEELVIGEVHRETLESSREQNPYLRDRRFDLVARADAPDWRTRR